MIYRNIKKLIERNSYDINDLMKKVDTFFLFNRITEDEYKELMRMLRGNK